MCNLKWHKLNTHQQKFFKTIQDMESLKGKFYSVCFTFLCNKFLCPSPQEPKPTGWSWVDPGMCCFKMLLRLPDT